MKAQCERCKEIVPLVFSTEAAGIRVTCPACAAEYFVAARTDDLGAAPPATAPAPASVPPAPATAATAAPDEMICPKCGEPQRRADACRRCGLSTDKFAAWDAARADDAALALGDVGSAAALFAACEVNWDDPVRHDAFIGHCQRADAWAYAAACYRKQTARADRRAIALARLADIRGLAEKSLVVLPRLDVAAPARNPMRTVALLAVVVVLLVAGVFLITSHFGAVARPGR